MSRLTGAGASAEILKLSCPNHDVDSEEKGTSQTNATILSESRSVLRREFPGESVAEQSRKQKVTHEAPRRHESSAGQAAPETVLNRAHLRGISSLGSGLEKQRELRSPTGVVRAREVRCAVQ